MPTRGSPISSRLAWAGRPTPAPATASALSKQRSTWAPPLPAASPPLGIPPPAAGARLGGGSQPGCPGLPRAAPRWPPPPWASRPPARPRGLPASQPSAAMAEATARAEGHCLHTTLPPPPAQSEREPLPPPPPFPLGGQPLGGQSPRAAAPGCPPLPGTSARLGSARENLGGTNRHRVKGSFPFPPRRCRRASRGPSSPLSPLSRKPSPTPMSPRRLPPHRPPRHGHPVPGLDRPLQSPGHPGPPRAPVCTNRCYPRRHPRRGPRLPPVQALASLERVVLQRHGCRGPSGRSWQAPESGSGEAQKCRRRRLWPTNRNWRETSPPT